jgi:hypothetical protein
MGTGRKDILVYYTFSNTFIVYTGPQEMQGAIKMVRCLSLLLLPHRLIQVDSWRRYGIEMTLESKGSTWQRWVSAFHIGKKA